MPVCSLMCRACMRASCYKAKLTHTLTPWPALGLRAMDRLGCTPWSGLHARQLSALAHTVVILHAGPLRTSKTLSRGREKKCQACAQRRGWKVMAEFQRACPLRYRCNDCRPGFNDCIPGCFKSGIRRTEVETGLAWLEEICMTLISTESKTQFSEPSAALAQEKLFRPHP